MRLTHRCFECRHPLVFHLEHRGNYQHDITGTDRTYAFNSCTFQGSGLACACLAFVIRASRVATHQAIDRYIDEPLNVIDYKVWE